MPSGSPHGQLEIIPPFETRRRSIETGTLRPVVLIIVLFGFRRVFAQRHGEELATKNTKSTKIILSLFVSLCAPRCRDFQFFVANDFDRATGDAEMSDGTPDPSLCVFVALCESIFLT